MRIHAISPFDVYSSKTNYNKKKNSSSIGDSVSFSGFNTIIKDAASHTFKTDKEVEEVFINIMDSIIKDKDIIKKAGFEQIQKIYQKSGFRGLLHELWIPNPNVEIKNLREQASDKLVTLALKDDRPVVKLFNMGKQGFWNLLFNRQNATYDSKLIFNIPQASSYLEFGLNKTGRITLYQKSENRALHNEFHRNTGNIAHRLLLGCGNPEATYYTKSGIEGGLNNHVFGGPIINLW